MKCTEYFKYVRKRPDREKIKEEWILKTMSNPVSARVQADGRIRKWGYIDEEGKYLRVILLKDGETVHNAFFDRGFKKEEK